LEDVGGDSMRCCRTVGQDGVDEWTAGLLDWKDAVSFQQSMFIGSTYTYSITHCRAGLTCTYHYHHIMRRSYLMHRQVRPSISSRNVISGISSKRTNSQYSRKV
jgi:hypothetical protein